MNKFKVLDCTLRDGGYINNFDFGCENTKKILSSLNEADIDVIECGFLRSGTNDVDSTLFNSVESISRLIPNPKKSLFVAMIQVGKFNVDDLPLCSSNGVDGIRLTFHKHEIDKALEDGRTIIKKGYKLFFQPVGTTSYSLSELEGLLAKVNSLNPYAFYIVDTLGLMFEEDVFELFSFVDKRLSQQICLGFHSHNNLQLSFSNAQSIFKMKLNRTIFLDSSLYGMGRGAGNLPSELICIFLNKKSGANYNLSSLIQTIDYFIAPLKNKYQWGYSIAYYLSSINGCHPNYASFLLNKQTLRIVDISKILESLNDEEKDLFNLELIKEKYYKYLNEKSLLHHHTNDLENLQCIFKNRNVLLVAPGKTSVTSFDKINLFSANNSCLMVAINKISDKYFPDFAFVSNNKKIDLITDTNARLIVTSNIDNTSLKDCFVVDYKLLKIENDDVKDNAGLMCVKLVEKLGAKNIYLAGFDGFEAQDFSYMLSGNLDNQTFADNLNKGIKRELNKISNNIFFITKSKYE